VKNAREAFIFVASVVAVFFLTTYALAGPGGSGTGPGGGCASATFSSAGCVTLAQIPGSDGGTASLGALAYTSQSTMTCAAADCDSEAEPGLYFPTTAANQYDVLKVGGDVGNPSSNWGFTLGILSSAPYFRSRAGGLGMDLATNGALFSATTNASDLGASANRWRSLYLGTDVYIAGTKTNGSCTFNGASPATCTATVLASAICICAPVGATAAIAAAGCAVGVSGTTLTITGPNAAGYAVNYHCFAP
jgi:hypothetical protein